MKTVCHYKRTDIAQAPDELVACINKYSEKYNAILFIDKNSPSIPADCHGYSENNPHIPIVHQYGKHLSDTNYDLIHFHNRFICVDKPSAILYHSPPEYVDFGFKGKKTVLAQYHATLSSYSDCEIVRNVIDFNNELYKENYNINKIKIGFSPSTRTSKGNTAYESKGWPETEEILLKLQSKYDVDVDIIHGVPLNECLARKSTCNIIIDECVTNSYHRSGLEGLAMGKLTICSLGADVIKVFKAATGSDTVPFENVWINDLEGYLEDIIIRNEPDLICQKGRKAREWMEQFWNPKTIVTEFENIYDKELK